MSLSNSRRTWGWRPAIALIVGAVVVSAALPALFDVIEDADPAATVPPDLRAALGPDLFQRLVPRALPVPDTTYSSGSDAVCDFRSDDRTVPRADTYGFLHVRVLRYGRIGWHSGADRAAEAHAWSCDASAIGGLFRDTSNLGDEACLAVQDEGEGGTASGSAVVRRGADVFWVDYYTHPGTAAEAERAVTDTVSAALTAVP
ncbi:hypothetical protein IU449_04590 [Nocardia higoensis]|uniref:DUF3558 domain-containing protein n=1 Tax=Nocardia higoensis TaxID=228599 RepID=A0ABS0DAD5_9NOCA|nr:hypothetical protein [Nocardia higoensis]MBF6353834.1 hypothetical protein [Nocardia higoensis]